MHRRIRERGPSVDLPRKGSFCFTRGGGVRRYPVRSAAAPLGRIGCCSLCSLRERVGAMWSSRMYTFLKKPWNSSVSRRTMCASVLDALQRQPLFTS